MFRSTFEPLNLQHTENFTFLSKLLLLYIFNFGKNLSIPPLNSFLPLLLTIVILPRCIASHFLITLCIGLQARSRSSIPYVQYSRKLMWWRHEQTHQGFDFTRRVSEEWGRERGSIDGLLVVGTWLVGSKLPPSARANVSSPSARGCILSLLFIVSFVSLTSCIVIASLVNIWNFRFWGSYSYHIFSLISSVLDFPFIPLLSLRRTLISFNISSFIQTGSVCCSFLH